MVYRWNGHGIKGISAEVAGECITKIVEKHGGITAEALLNEARRKKHPLHDAFEWDDKKAGELYRVDQARYIIRSVVVEHEEQPTVRVRAFVNVVEREVQHYTTIESAMRNPELRGQVYAKALAELNCWKSKYEDLRQFGKVIKAIEELPAA